MSIRAYKGTEDKFGRKAAVWRHVEDVLHSLCRDYCYHEIRTPMFEFTELFTRGVGETTDIVTKEMFSFKDRGDRSLTLKPELTAGVARAYLEHGMKQLPQPVKLYYIQPCFRAERPQKGRNIEFSQFGIEYFGSASPLAEAEILNLVYELIRRVGLTGITLYINSLGCPSCREKYNAALKAFIGEKISLLCPTCHERFEKNPLRVLDCKNEDCQKAMNGAPYSADMLCGECDEHFNGVKSALDGLGLEYTVDKGLVRGLDYYTRTVFEFKSNQLGAQNTVCAGGRYDTMIEGFGGEPTCAVGFGMGMERFIMLLEEQELLGIPESSVDIFIGSIGHEAALKALSLCNELRARGCSAECDTLSRSAKSQMKLADKLNAAYSMIIGEDEMQSGKARLKNMQNGEHAELELSADAILLMMPDIDSGRCETV